MARILVIDDQLDVRTILSRLLAGAGHDTVTASNGLDGLRLHEQQSFDLIITDIVMPEKEGLETIRDLRRKDKTVRLIAISGFTDSPYLECARLLGADRILGKPCSRDDLLAAVEAVLSAKSGSPKGGKSP